MLVRLYGEIGVGMKAEDVCFRVQESSEIRQS